MDQRTTEQLAKVLAMADSAHDGEAIIAVRKARQLLSRGGLNFGDLARAAFNRPRFNFPIPFFNGHQVNLEMQIVQLRQQLQDLQADLQAQNLQVEFWHRRAAELEQNSHANRAEALRWQQLARETAEQLWDLGNSLKPAEPQSQDENDKALSPHRGERVG